MLKYAILACTGLLAMQLMNADGVIIEDNTPGSLQPGDTETVTITINKGSVEGFAKLELTLPAGLSAEAVNSNGASFTFAGQKAKFIWMSLPDDPEFSVTYNLIAAEDASGEKAIQGVFAYIKENQRVDYALKEKVIRVGGMDEAAAETDSNESTSSQNTSGSELPVYEGNDLQCVRFTEQNTATEHVVHLRVVNSDLTGFVKLSERIPDGFTAEALDSDGAIVTNDSGNLKYVWFEAPAENEFRISYVLRGSGVPSVDGDFAFVRNNAPYEQPIKDLGIMSMDEIAGADTAKPAGETSSEELASNNAEGSESETESGSEEATTQPADGDSEALAETVAGTVAAPDETENREAVLPGNASETEEVQETEESSAATSFPDPETGITYKVQIVAAQRTVGKTYFSARHQFKESFNIENHNGWVKYTTGKHAVYRAARDDRNRIASDYPSFQGPFVTAYSDGVRITVQEALMISKQDWYK